MGNEVETITKRARVPRNSKMTRNGQKVKVETSSSCLAMRTLEAAQRGTSQHTVDTEMTKLGRQLPSEVQKVPDCSPPVLHITSWSSQNYYKSSSPSRVMTLRVSVLSPTGARAPMDDHEAAL